jgi:hypothetical protein
MSSAGPAGSGCHSASTNEAAGPIQLAKAVSSEDRFCPKECRGENFPRLVAETEIESPLWRYAKRGE